MCNLVLKKWEEVILTVSSLPLSLPLHTHAVHDAYSAVNDKMQRMVINHANRFELLREAFNVPLKRNEDIQDEIKGSILDMVENFSGDITVKGTQYAS